MSNESTESAADRGIRPQFRKVGLVARGPSAGLASQLGSTGEGSAQRALERILRRATTPAPTPAHPSEEADRG